MKSNYLLMGLAASTIILIWSFAFPEQVQTLYIIGDSTASDYASSSYPRTGWGSMVQYYFDQAKIEVDNRALSGRSSKSFYHENGAWNSTISAISSGDYLIIQFGHNDQKSDEERHTDPYTTYQEYLKKYIDEAKAKGAHPILATSIHRNGWSGSSIKDSHGDYPKAMRELATSLGVPLIDLHAQTKELFESLGENFTTNNLFLNLQPGQYPNYPNGNNDNTHLQELGAVKIAGLAAEAISTLAADHNNLSAMAEAQGDIGFVQVNVSDETKGQVQGSGYGLQGDSITLTAKPYSGFAIKSWSMDGQIIGTGQDQQVLLNSDTISVDAVFDVGYAVVVRRNPARGGRVTGAGSYVEGASVSVTASSNEGYYFVNWTIDGAEVSRDSAYSFVVGTDDVDISANFTDEKPLGTLPASDLLIYSSDGKLQVRRAEEIAEIAVLDLMGVEMFRDSKWGDGSRSISFLPSGIYIVKLLTTKGEMHISRILMN